MHLPIIQRLQGLRAPFVLENLNCSGTEERLLDCPGVMVDDPYGPFYEYYGNVYQYGRFPSVCDPLLGTYTIVACGNEIGPGAASFASFHLLPRA